MTRKERRDLIAKITSDTRAKAKAEGWRESELVMTLLDIPRRLRNAERKLLRQQKKILQSKQQL